MPIRKQSYALRAIDFERFPVWEFALDEEGREGQDEATVRPYRRRGRLDPRSGMFVVRATFQFADGSSGTGYLTPPVQGNRSLGTLQPIVLTPRGQVGFWCGAMRPKRADLDRLYRRLRRRASEVFPCRFRSDVPLRGGAVEGTLAGFLYL